MPLRETFAALLPDLARQVPGLLDGLDADDVMMLRTRAEAAAPAHVKSLVGFQKHALAAGEKAFSGQGDLNFPATMAPEARRVHAICRCLRFYDFLTGSLERILSSEDPTMTTVVASKVEADCYLQREDQETPTEFVTTPTHMHRILAAKRGAMALCNCYGPVIFLQQQMMHNSVSLCHPSVELCAKSVLDANYQDGLCVMAAAGLSLQHSLRAAGFLHWASLTHASSCFRWRPFNLRGATAIEMQRVMRSALYLSHRISVGGSLATNAGDSRHVNEDARSSDAMEREFRKVSDPNGRGDIEPAPLGAQGFCGRMRRDDDWFQVHSSKAPAAAAEGEAEEALPLTPEPVAVVTRSKVARLRRSRSRIWTSWPAST